MEEWAVLLVSNPAVTVNLTELRPSLTSLLQDVYNVIIKDVEKASDVSLLVKLSSKNDYNDVLDMKSIDVE